MGNATFLHRRTSRTIPFTSLFFPILKLRICIEDVSLVRSCDEETRSHLFSGVVGRQALTDLLGYPKMMQLGDRITSTFFHIFLHCGVSFFFFFFKLLTLQEYQDLLSKRDIILNDKRKIEAVILDLDEKKQETLRRTWIKVNKDLDSIFSTLLPHASAKLAAPPGFTETEGLEIKVAFGGVWKASLSELSGGQRSLLALSLVLALLLFKPAPMYILDEIDSALDLSHTQNIGHMIRTHFPHSQFIVVSLKELWEN